MFVRLWLSSADGNTLFTFKTLWLIKDARFAAPLKEPSKHPRKYIKPPWPEKVLGLPILIHSSKPKVSHLLKTTSLAGFIFSLSFLITDQGGALLLMKYSQALLALSCPLSTYSARQKHSRAYSLDSVLLDGYSIIFLSSSFWRPFFFSSHELRGFILYIHTHRNSYRELSICINQKHVATCYACR